MCFRMLVVGSIARAHRSCCWLQMIKKGEMCSYARFIEGPQYVKNKHGGRWVSCFRGSCSGHRIYIFTKLQVKNSTKVTYFLLLHH
ncbi:hypothetical protein GDO81_027861 [Engystomops pustulosus]|uniref:Secreted protein n=1 Tax=Engystomops pustulosus TaxID=76066 RepID=A0AAV6YLU5_ENGPU|nr:hypothetical protein GDO81_027861 [Engystomops pustulosus]